MITKWMNGEHRLNSAIKIATSSSSSQQGTRSMLWHGIYWARKKKIQIAQLKKYVTHLRISVLPWQWSLAFFLIHSTFAQSFATFKFKVVREKKKMKCKSILCSHSSIECFFLWRKFEPLIVCWFYIYLCTKTHTQKIKLPQMLSLSHKKWKWHFDMTFLIVQ